MALDYKFLINEPNPTDNASCIVQLIIDILVLEERLNNDPDDQSDYFRWAKENHSLQLTKLVDDYNLIRKTYNSYTKQQLQNEIIAQELNMASHAHITPLLARNMYLSRAHCIIFQMRDMIAIKKIIDQLPTIGELKQMPEFLEELFDASI